VIAVRHDKPLAEGVADLNGLLDRYAGAQMPEAEVHAEDDATILYTSGSTGHPKGAVSCQRNIISALLSWELDARAAAMTTGIEPAQPEAQPATLLAVPLFHATGSHAVFLSSFRSQRRLVCMYKWDVTEAAELIEAEQISSVVAPSAMTGDLIEYARRNGRDLSSLITVGGGGAARAPEQVRNIEKTFARALPNTGWGMTETNAIGTGIGGQDYLDHPASSGRCSAVLDIRVVDEYGNELPVGERGELQVRGTSVIRGYWQRPDANAETFDGRWLRTGDVALIDDEGYLYIVDRIKDLVIRGGENIGCGAVEAALLEHPLVLEASVYAVPDQRLGEEVGATVYTSAPLDEDALREFLVPHLARFEIPRYFHFAGESLPRTASGKILKRQLREEAAARVS
jgi:long-chain acyl-CoA synthetase